jgi:hypothetical protein
MKYPQNMIEFIDSFHTEEQCLLYLEQIRWEWACPKCRSEKYWRHGTRRVRICAWCRSTLCVTAWTALHRLRIPLRTLFLIGWLMVTSKQWIMVLDDRAKLSWDVEVDEVFVWWKREWKRGRWAEWKVRVAVAVEVNMSEKNKKWLFRGMGRVRMKVIPNCGEQTLAKFIEENVEKGSTLYTDWWLWYKNIGGKGYVHIIESESITDDNVVWISTQEVTPNVHIIASLVKRWLLGTHQQYLTQDGYLQDYLEEYTFRFNRRKSSDRWKLFGTLLEQIMTHSPTTGKQIKT